VGLDVGVMWRHHRDDGLAQSRGRLRSKVAQGVDPMGYMGSIP
jgi:hypothetical protein